MRKLSLAMSTLLAASALAMAPAAHGSVEPAPRPRRRRVPEVVRYPGSYDALRAERAAHNEAVEKRKAERLARRAQRGTSTVEFIISLVILLAALVFAGWVADARCEKRWARSGMQSDWGFGTGCVVRRADGTWLPEQMMRDLPLQAAQPVRSEVPR